MHWNYNKNRSKSQRSYYIRSAVNYRTGEEKPIEIKAKLIIYLKCRNERKMEREKRELLLDAIYKRICIRNVRSVCSMHTIQHTRVGLWHTNERTMCIIGRNAFESELKKNWTKSISHTFVWNVFKWWSRLPSYPIQKYIHIYSTKLVWRFDLGRRLRYRLGTGVALMLLFLFQFDRSSSCCAVLCFFFNNFVVVIHIRTYFIQRD